MRGLKSITRILLLAIACLAITAGVVRAEMVRELVYINGVVPLPLHGIGIVTGLAGTGDKSSAARSMLHKYLSNNHFDLNISELATGSVALVKVSGEIPPFSRPGNKFAVTVTTLSDAKSLKGGELMQCQLFDGTEDLETKSGPVIAVANGQVVTGDGILTRGKILAGQNTGAIQMEVYPFGKVMNAEGVIRLNLNTPNYADATAIARQINQTPFLNPNLQEATMFADAEPSQPVAYARDMGQVLVRVPEQYRTSLTMYIDNILKVPVPVDRPAKIVVNRASNSIVVTGDIRVNNATISLQDKTVTVRPETETEPALYTLENDTPRNMVELDGPGTFADLQGLIDTLNAMGLTTDQIITVFEQLRSAGAIHADMLVE